MDFRVLGLPFLIQGTGFFYRKSQGKPGKPPGRLGA